MSPTRAKPLDRRSRSVPAPSSHALAPSPQRRDRRGGVVSERATDAGTRSTSQLIGGRFRILEIRRWPWRGTAARPLLTLARGPRPQFSVMNGIIGCKSLQVSQQKATQAGSRPWRPHPCP
jgi:hypothetical protein